MRLDWQSANRIYQIYDKQSHKCPTKNLTNVKYKLRIQLISIRISDNKPNFKNLD